MEVMALAQDYEDFLATFLVMYGNDAIVQDWSRLELGSIAAVDNWIANNPSVLYYTISNGLNIVRQKINGVVVVKIDNIYI